MSTLLRVSDLHFGPPSVPRVDQALADTRPDHHDICVQAFTGSLTDAIRIVVADGDLIFITHFMFFNDKHRFAPIGRRAFPRPGRDFVGPERVGDSTQTASCPS